MPTKKPKENPEPQDGKVIAAVEEEIDPQGKSTKKLNYNIPLDEIKNEEKNNLSDEEPEFDLSDVEDFSEREIEEIPKSKLELMFDDVRAISKHENDSFFALINRQPDFMSDNFYIRCDTEKALGSFQFTQNDLFNFVPFIQKLENSGCRVNVRVYRLNREPATIARYDVLQRPFVGEIGIVNLYIPNPVKELTEHIVNNQGNSEDKFLEYARQSEQRIITLITEINKPKPQSTLEKAFEQKMINDIVNPPQAQNSPSVIADALKHEIAQIRLIDKILPESPASPEKLTWYEEFLRSEEVKNGIINIAGNLFADIQDVVKTKAFANLTPEQQAKVREQNAAIYEEEEPEEEIKQPPQLSPEQQKQNANMNELVSQIVTELESGNKIDNDNPLVTTLSNQYKTEFAMLKIACQTMSFNELLGRLAGSVPDTIKPYLDPAFITEQGIIAVPNGQGETELMFKILTDEEKASNGNFKDGLRMKGRLLELYNFMKS